MQDGNNNNNFNNSGDNNNFHFSQSQNDEKAVRMVIDENNSKTVNKEEVHNKAIGSLVTSFSAMVVTLVSVASDCFGLGEKLGISPEILLAIAIPLSLIPTVLNFNFIRYYFRRPRHKTEAKYIGQGEIIQFNDEGNYLVTPLKAPCQAPYCNGIIGLVSTPEREVKQLQMCYVAVCSISGKDHSYIVSPHWIATLTKLDWRPFDKK